MLTGATSSKAFVLRVPDSVPTNGRTKNALLFVDRKGVVLVLVGSQGGSPRELRSRDLLNPSGLKKRLESWFIVGRFLSDQHWPVLGDHRGWPDPEGRRPAGRGVAHAHLQIGAGPPRCPCRSAVCAVILPSHPRILLQSHLRTIPVRTVARTSVCRVETRLDAPGTAQIRPRHECRGCKQECLRHKNTNSQF